MRRLDWRKKKSSKLFLWLVKSVLYPAEDLSTNFKPLMRGNNKSLFILIKFTAKRCKFIKVLIGFCYKQALSKKLKI